MVFASSSETVQLNGGLPREPTYDKPMSGGTNLKREPTYEAPTSNGPGRPRPRTLDGLDKVPKLNLCNALKMFLF